MNEVNELRVLMLKDIRNFGCIDDLYQDALREGCQYEEYAEYLATLTDKEFYETYKWVIEEIATQNACSTILANLEY